MEHSNFFFLDTFSSKEFQGNPTPIYLMKNTYSKEKMKQLAKEFNAPVTVFVQGENNGNTYRIFYFTVKGEIPACGHGTLGAAYVLFNQNRHLTSVDFVTKEGILLTATKNDGTTFIQYPKFDYLEAVPNDNLKEALGIKHYKSCFFCQELETLFIELVNAEAVRGIQPDFNKLIQSTDTIKEVVVMGPSDNDSIDFILRSFCPWIGIDEDPVTGSIHSVLGHFWKSRLNKDVLQVRQASARGGNLTIMPLKNAVKIGGDCKILIEGRTNEISRNNT